MSFLVSRRGFLGAMATTAGAVLTAPRLLRAADDNSKYGGFPMGIQSYTLRNFPVDKALEIIHDDLGLHYVEMFGAHFPGNSTDDQIQQMKSKLAGKDIKLTAHGVNGFSKDHEANRRWFEFAKKAGIRNISADPSEDSFDSLDKLVEEYDVRIAIHNHGPGARYDKVADVLNAIKGHNPKIGACADLGHYIRSGEDPMRVIHLLEGRLYGIHLKDFAAPKGDAAGVILGKGHLDCEGVFKALKKVNFPADGGLSLEYEEHAENPIPDVKECLAVAAEGAQKAARG
jgi:inosose dehydratase